MVPQVPRGAESFSAHFTGKRLLSCVLLQLVRFEGVRRPTLEATHFTREGPQVLLDMVAEQKFRGQQFSTESTRKIFGTMDLGDVTLEGGSTWEGSGGTEETHKWNRIDAVELFVGDPLLG